MKLDWTLTCRRALIDRDTGLPSVIDIFGRATLPEGAPTEVILPIEFAVVARWKAEKGEPSGTKRKYEFRLSLGKKEVVRVGGEIVFDSKGVSTAVAQISGIPVAGNELTLESWDLHKNKKAGFCTIAFDRSVSTADKVGR